MLWPLLLLPLLPYSSTSLQTCPQPPCPCFPTNGRREVRHLSVKERGKVAAAFKSARELVPQKAWSQPGRTMCLLVNSLDAALRPTRFPYWDSRIEYRMTNPKDSFIFLGKFFPDKNAKRRRRSRGRRGRSELTANPAMPPLVFAALRSGRHAQLLLFMHQVGLEMRRFVNDTCEDLCPGQQQYLACSRGHCISKLRSGAHCHPNSPSDCYDSVCINSICSVPSVKKQPAEVETYKVIRDEGLTLQIVQLPDESSKASGNIIEGSGQESERQKNFYEVQTTAVSAPNMLEILHQKKILDYNGSLPFPTIYIPISITRRRQIRRYTDNQQRYIVYSQGANFPNGYTQQVLGLMTNSSRAYVRVLDPLQANLAVEVNIVVEYNGIPCEATCLGQRNSYKPCSGRLRLSKYRKLTDPIQWYKQPSDIPTTWTGTGYYRKPSSDYLLYKCV